MALNDEFASKYYLHT